MNDIQQAKCNQIADFLMRRPNLVPRVASDYYWATNPLPTVEEFARAVLADSEGRALHLGGWLGSPDGEIVERAVAMVIPPFYRPEYNLVVDGLKLAAKMQTQGKQHAGLVGLAFIAGGLGVAYLGRTSAA